MTVRVAVAVLFSWIVLSPAGCREPGPTAPPAPATVPMIIGRETFNLEVADTPAKQRRGLMDRPSMPADHGMIFVFPEPKEQSFWMRNTYIPLDILYLDENGRIVSIKQMKPLEDEAVHSDGPAMFAVELNQGAAARVGVKPGDVLTIPSAILTGKDRK